MKKIIFAFLSFSSLLSMAQTDAGKKEELSMDLLQAPSSPGFILLNKQPTDIEKPTNTTDFIVSVRNATDGFSAIPKNYAVEFAPVWLFNGKKISFADLLDTTNNLGKTFGQSLSLSTAINTDNTTNITELGTGFKFSLLRGQHISSEFYKANNERMAALRRVTDIFTADTAKAKMNSRYIALIKDSTISDAQREKYVKEQTDSLNYYGNLMTSKANSDGTNSLALEESKLKKLSQTKLTRYGWFLDVAGGLVTNFRQQKFDNSVVPKYGAWFTFGYTAKQNITFLVLGRELFQQNEKYTNTKDTVLTGNLIHHDGGLRLIIDKNKFTFSLETLGRLTAGVSDIKPTYAAGWKAMLNIGYDIGNNRILTFNIGRDFDGNVTKGGNLIAALNLVMGFGSTRKIAN